MPPPPAWGTQPVYPPQYAPPQQPQYAPPQQPQYATQPQYAPQPQAPQYQQYPGQPQAPQYQQHAPQQYVPQQFAPQQFQVPGMPQFGVGQPGVVVPQATGTGKKSKSKGLIVASVVGLLGIGLVAQSLFSDKSTSTVVPLAANPAAVTDSGDGFVTDQPLPAAAAPSTVVRDDEYFRKMTTGGPLRLGPLASSLTEANFNQSVSQQTTVVMFGATWCTYCHQRAPLLATERAKSDSFALAALDIDEQQSLAVEYQVMTLPTTVIFVNGKEVSRKTGFMDEGGLHGWLEKYN